MNVVKLQPKPKKLTEQIYESLKRDIIECLFEPGQALAEIAIHERYQIGHTPFREACHRLEAEGLIEIIPHRGIFVASFSKRDIRDLFEVRIALESFATELACRRSRPEQFQELEQNLHEHSRLQEEKPTNIIREINWNNQAFHLGVARLSDNLELQNLVENVHSKLMRIIMFTAQRTPVDQLFSDCHSKILDAIRRGHQRDARKWLIKDIEATRDWIREFGD